MESREILLQQVVIAGVILPPSGDDGESRRVTTGTRREVTRGAGTSIVSRVGQPDDRVSITTYGEDAAHARMRTLYLAQEAAPPGVRPRLFGSAANFLTGESFAWDDAVIERHSDGVHSATPTTVTWTLICSKMAIQ